MATTDRFVPAADLPANAQAISWIDHQDGTHEHQFHKTVRAAKMAYKRDSARSVHVNGWMAIEDSHRAHGVMVW